MPIKIDFISNVTEFLRGTRDVEDALDDVADSLDDVAKDSDGALERAEKGFRDLADEARDTSKDIDKVADAGKRIGDDVRDGTKRAEEGLTDLKDESASTAREAAASFDGSAESIAEGFQEVAANAFGGFGPAGAAAGLAAAAGIGLATQAFTDAQEAADEARESAFEFAYSVSGALEAAGYAERIAEWTGNTDKFREAQEIAKISGRDVVDVVDAIASGGEKLDGLWDDFEEGAERGAIATGTAYGAAAGLEGVLKAVREGYASGAEAADIAARANYNFATAAGVATGETDDLGNAIYELPDGKQMVVDVETQRAYEDLDAVEARKVNDKTMTVRTQIDDYNIRTYNPRMITIPTRLGRPDGRLP
jgi:hypothetical protein